MSEAIDLNALTKEALSVPPVAEWDEPGEVDDFIARLVEAVVELGAELSQARNVISKAYTVATMENGKAAARVLASYDQKDKG